MTLMKNDISHLGKSAKANNLLATYFVFEGMETTNPQEKQKLYQDAERLFARAVSIYPNYFNAWYDLARTKVFLGKKEGALEAFSRAVRLDSTFVGASLQAAVVADELNAYNEAIENYYRVILLQPTNIEAYTGLSFVYFRLKDYESSINVNLRCIDRNPDAVEPQVNIGKTLMHIGENVAAVEYLEKAWQLDMTNQELLEQLIAVLREIGEGEKADYYEKFAMN